jgi:protein gp37
MSKQRTKIEWCDYTVNCFWGCDKGCPYCAARKIARRFGRHIGERRGYSREIIERMAEFKPVFLPDQLELINKIKQPSKLFVSEMGDWCGENVPAEWTERALEYMRRFSRHTFITSTKKPQNLLNFTYPKNCWVGIGATDRTMAHEAISIFGEVNTQVKYLMCEPLLSRMGDLDLSGISLVIIGAQTQPYRPPEVEWVEEIAAAADRSGTAVFIKNNLKSLLEPVILKYESIRLGTPVFSQKPFATLRQELWSTGYFSR